MPRRQRGSSNSLDYITYNALDWRSCSPVNLKRVQIPAAGFDHDGPRRCVVLTDEIDKAPRFSERHSCEVEEMYFRI
jgi:hypothetical protein